MVWINLGTLSISPEWQRFDVSFFDDVLVRIKQDYNAKPIGYALICSEMLDGSRTLFDRVYPNKENRSTQVFRLAPEFQAAGLFARYFSIKNSVRTRSYDLTWKVTLEVWSQAIEPDGGDYQDPESGEVVSGGDYP